MLYLFFWMNLWIEIILWPEVNNNLIIIFFDKVFTFMFRFTVDELKRDAKQKTNINSMKDLRLSPTFVQQCWILSEQLFCDIVVHNAIHIVIGCTEYRDFLKKWSTKVAITRQVYCLVYNMWTIKTQSSHMCCATPQNVSSTCCACQ